MSLFVPAFLAISLTLAGSKANIPSVSNPGFLPLAAATQLQKLLKCDEVYPVISDPNRAARMNGFYCVTGLRANFRLVKMFDSTKAANDDTDLYEPIQTGGRRLYLGKNWFVFGFPQDVNAVVASRFVQKTDAGLGLTDYTTNQDLCMGLSSAAMESHFDDLTGEKRHFQDLEWLFKGGTKQVQAAINRYSAQLKKSLLGENAFAMEQDLAQASLTYRPFCLKQKGQHFSRTHP